MMVSADTLAKLADVLRQVLPPELRRKIARELLKVPGNKSFRDTVAALHEELERGERP